ncbi:MAG: tyrosine-type recombinase/integrase [Hyphomicrobiaceae bacterium]
MPRLIKRLNARAVQTLTKPGRHSDGGGLYLVVDQRGSKRWIFLYRRRRDGKLSEMGLGGLTAVPLAEARKKAAEARALLASGRDPIESRRSDERQPAIPTFAEMADQVIAALEGSWRNEKHRAQWRTTLTTYCAPIRSKPVDAIQTADVLAILSPIWRSKAETASRLRGRIEKVLDAAKAHGFRTGENPARWRGHLDHLLGKRPKLRRGHHPAMPWQEVPTFVRRLRARNGTAARCLEFIILTQPRSGEVLRSVRDGQIEGMRWIEIDWEAGIWTVPAVRMKTGREHRKPLSARALGILREMYEAQCGDFVFPSQDGNIPLSDMALEMVLRRMDAKPATVHGFRSSFRDWAGEATSHPREIAEAALSHTVGDAVERAYRRGDALEKRRALMEAWARFCDGADNIINLAEHSA